MSEDKLIGHMVDSIGFKNLSEEQIEELKKPIGAKFLSTRFDGLTSIKSIAVTMRLNNVFGFGKWQIRVKDMNTRPTIQKTKKGDRDVFYSVCHVTLSVPEYGIHYECEAGSMNEEEGDSKKGAITDSITKIASWLGIGYEIYCGK